MDRSSGDSTPTPGGTTNDESSRLASQQYSEPQSPSLNAEAFSILAKLNKLAPASAAKDSKKDDGDAYHSIGVASIRRYLLEKFPQLHIDTNAASILQTLCDKIVFLIAREVLLMKVKKRGEMAIVKSDIDAAIHAISELQPVAERLQSKGEIGGRKVGSRQISMSEIMRREARSVHPALLDDPDQRDDEENDDLELEINRTLLE